MIIHVTGRLKLFESVIINSSIYHKIRYVGLKEDYNSIMPKKMERKKSNCLILYTYYKGDKG